MTALPLSVFTRSSVANFSKATRPIASSLNIYRSKQSPFINSKRNMSSGLDIENTNIKTAAGVDLSQQQKTLVGSVLDLFAGRPSLQKLKLWSDEGVFEDPLTVAQGRKQYEAQWYGLQQAFSEIERLHHEVTSSGNPITMDLKTRYVVKGIGKEQTINSVITIFTSPDGSKIEKVQDKWDGELSDSSIKTAFRRLNAVTVPHLVSVPKNEEEDQKLK